MYDEPTAGLDPIASTVVEDLIRSVHINGRDAQGNPGTIASYVVVTHQHSTIRRAVDRYKIRPFFLFCLVGEVNTFRMVHVRATRFFLWSGVFFCQLFPLQACHGITCNQQVVAGFYFYMKGKWYGKVQLQNLTHLTML